MVIKNNLLKTAVLASSLSLMATVQPAWSNQWTDMFRSLLIPQTGIANDPITARDTQITNRIIDAINANKLSPAETQNLKNQMDNIKSMEARYRSNSAGGQLGPIETASLNAEMNKVELTLNQLIGNVGSTTFGGSVTANVDSSDGAFADIKGRITRNLANGRLTIEEARNLKEQYDRAWSERNNFKADGVISNEESNRLNQLVEDLKRSVSSNTRDTQAWNGIDGQQAAQAKRIEDGIASGRITRNEYEQLKSESDRIASFEARARSNGLQLGETITLATDLNNLNTRLNSSLNNNNTADNRPGWGNGPGWGRPGDRPDRPGDRPGWGQSDSREFDMRQAQVMRRIDETSQAGRITLAEAEDLRADYRRLEQLESSYRADGNLSSNELVVLQRGLDSITNELKDRANTTVNVAVQYPEIDRKQAQIQARIDDALAKRRISSLDARKFQDNLTWIAAVEQSLRQSGGNLDKAEADRIIADLDRLSVKVDRVAISPQQTLLARKSELQRKIDENRAKGKLSMRTSQSLMRELDRIAFSIQALGNSSNVRPDVIARINADMDRLNTSITSGLTYGGPGRGWNQR